MKNLLIIMLLFNNIFSYAPNLTVEGGADVNFHSNNMINSYLNISGEIFINKMLTHEDFFSVYVGPVFEINYFKKVQGILGINWILFNNCKIIRDICSVRILIGIKYLPIKYLNFIKFFFTFKNDKKWIIEIKLDFSKTAYKKHYAFIRVGTILNYNSNKNIDNFLTKNNPNWKIEVETNDCSKEDNNKNIGDNSFNNDSFRSCCYTYSNKDNSQIDDNKYNPQNHSSKVKNFFNKFNFVQNVKNWWSNKNNNSTKPEKTD